MYMQIPWHCQFNPTGELDMRNFLVGDHVKDTDTGECGVVVHVYEDPQIRAEIVAVRFGASSSAVAVPLDTLVRVKPSRLLLQHR
jgi:hypothetical protein